jgi:DNA-binding CsgD family transcriptional regulator/tetratricopeptide (TPR) repeat protein
VRQVLCPQLIGRDDEMNLLGAALDAAVGGNGGVVLILGEAGVGKSRLTREVQALARDLDFQMLRGRAVEGSSGAYRPLAEALLSALRSSGLDLADLNTVTDLDPFRPILGRLIPEWHQDSRFGGVTDDSTVLVGEAILRLLRVLADGRGSLLVLEDLHGADADTLAVVEYLVDNVQTEPVVVLGTVRSDEPSAALTQAHSIAARRGGQILELASLDRASVELMARVCLDVAICPEPVVELLTAYSDGLPFLVEELLASWVSSSSLVQSGDNWAIVAELAPVAPLTFAETVKRRLGTLRDGTRRLLECAAVLGPQFDWTLLPETSGLDKGDVLNMLRDAINAQLVTVDAGQERRPLYEGTDQREITFGFRHALTRAAILAELLPPERAALSARLLSLVEQVHPGLPDEWCDLAATLAEGAGDPQRSARLRLESGRRALARGTLTTAENTLRRAQSLRFDDEQLSAEIEEALTEALSLAGKWDDAVAVGEHLLKVLVATPATEDRQANVHLCIAGCAIAAGRWLEAADHLDRTRLLLPGVRRTDMIARLDALSAHLAIERAQISEAIAFAQAALDAAERAGQPDIACEALEVLGRCARVHDLDGAEAAFGRARRIAEENGLTVWRIRALHELGTLDIFRNARIDRLAEARDLAMTTGTPATAAVLDVQIAACLDQRGEFEAELEIAHRSEVVARRFHLHVTAAMALAFQGAAHAKLGNRVQMERAIDEALRLGGNEPDVVACVWEDRAFASLADEKRAQACSELETAMATVEGKSATTPGPFRGMWALLRTIDGIDGSAACELVRQSGVTINPVNRAYLGYAEAILLGRSGRREAATATAARADADLAGLTWYHHMGHRVTAEVAIADGWGESAPWLWDASSYFEQRGLEKVASACRALLRRMGVPGAHTTRTHEGVPAPLRSFGMTHREFEVLSLLAEGLSNKEIGTRLFLSPRTVEKHVASLLAKTETRTRAQLAALAVSASLEPATTK